MGIFDSYFEDLQKEVSRMTDGISKLQGGTQKMAQDVVGAIDNLEDKVTHLPTEQQIKNKLKKKINTRPDSTHRKAKPAKKDTP